jgi:hypothetical protein
MLYYIKHKIHFRQFCNHTKVHLHWHSLPCSSALYFYLPWFLGQQVGMFLFVGTPKEVGVCHRAILVCVTVAGIFPKKLC